MKDQFRIVSRQESTNLADEMMKHAQKMAAAVLEQRETILEAFIAQHGFKPDECQQVFEANSWCVVWLDPKKVERIQRELVREQIRKKKGLSRWKLFCLHLAGW